MMRVVADGWWCESCEFFEDDDDVNPQDENGCESCGHGPTDHTPVEVITKGLD